MVVKGRVGALWNATRARARGAARRAGRSGRDFRERAFGRPLQDVMVRHAVKKLGKMEG